MPDLEIIYLTDLRDRVAKLRATAEGAFAQIDEAQWRAAPDPDTNSIAVTVKHIAGNLRSRFTDFPAADGEKPDRGRDDEFILTPADTRASLLRQWAAAWHLLDAALGALGPGDLCRTTHIRREPHSVIGALNRALVHLAYHVGQIVLLAKHYAGSDWRTLSIARAPRSQTEPRGHPEVR